MTRAASQREAALYLVHLGLNDSQVGRVLAIPRVTIRDWRCGKIPGARRSVEDCPRCHSAPLNEKAYAYLLGLYLGDGCLSESRRGVFRLRIACCDAYPGLMDECEAAILAMRPSKGKVIGRVASVGCSMLGSYWKHWPCLFPQHGTGRKHHRPIVLESWQEEILHRHPSLLLRGLIHSDGWRGTNLVRRRGKTYEYDRYTFSNRSTDIREIFCQAADLFDVSWRQSDDHTIAISRRSEVAKLDKVVGHKY